MENENDQTNIQPESAATAPAGNMTEAAPETAPVNTVNTMPQEEIPAPKKEGAVGAVIGSIIIIILLVLGGLYFFGSVIENKEDTNSAADTSAEEVSEIEEDLNSAELEAELNQMDADLAEIEAEINAAVE